VHGEKCRNEELVKSEHGHALGTFVTFQRFTYPVASPERCNLETGMDASWSHPKPYSGI
jgi:hypothetical protein